MNNESRLLSKIVSENKVNYALERGVSVEWFNDAGDKNLFKFLHNHFTNYQESPSLELINDNFPTYQPEKVIDSIDYYIDKVVEARRKALIISSLTGAIQKLESSGDHESALDTLNSGLLVLEQENLGGINDLQIRNAAQTALAEYEHRKNNPGLLGYPTGFPTMDAVTSGLQPGQLVVIVAPPKTGKSTLALQIAINNHLDGHVPLFISFEKIGRAHV